MRGRVIQVLRALYRAWAASRRVLHARRDHLSHNAIKVGVFAFHDFDKWCLLIQEQVLVCAKVLGADTCQGLALEPQVLVFVLVDNATQHEKHEVSLACDCAGQDQIVNFFLNIFKVSLYVRIVEG